MDRSRVKEITRMGKKMVNGLFGIRMDRKGVRELTRV
jgi:hypothetical protein